MALLSFSAKSGASDEPKPARWASFDASGVNEQERQLRRARYPKRLRFARVVFAGAFALAAMALLVLALLALNDQIAQWRYKRSGFTGFIIGTFYTENAIAAWYAEFLLVLLAAACAASLTAGVFSRLFRGSAWALRSLYDWPILAGLATIFALSLAASLPYLAEIIWTNRIDAPSGGAIFVLAVGGLIAIVSGRRAERLAQPPIAPEPEPLQDVGSPDRPSRAVVAAHDPLARAAFERLLKADGFIVPLSTASAEETRAWFRNHGRGADVLLLNDDLADISPPVLITQLSSDAQSAIGLVHLGPRASLPSGRAYETRGRIVSITHVQTPTTRAPLVAAVREAAETARARREDSAPKSEARDELGALAKA